MRVQAAEAIIIPLAQFSKFTMYLVSALVLNQTFEPRWSGILPPYPTYIMLYGVCELIAGLVAFTGKKEAWWLTLIVCILPVAGFSVAHFASFLNWASGFSLQWLVSLVSFPFYIPLISWTYSGLVIIISSTSVVELLLLFNGHIRERYGKSAINRQSMRRLIDWSLGN